VLERHATTLTRSTLSIFGVSNAEDPVGRRFPFFGRRNGSERDTGRWTSKVPHATHTRVSYGGRVVGSSGRGAVIRSAVSCPTHEWSLHARSLAHLGVLLITFLRSRIGEILVRSNLGSNQINVRHCTWPRSGPTESFGVEPVWIEVSVKLIFSLVSSEEEKNDHDQGEDTDGTSNDTTGNGRSVRRRSSASAIRLGREDELGGPHCLRLDLAVRVSGSGNHVKRKNVLTIGPYSETKKGTYTMTVLNTTVEVDERGVYVEDGGT